FDGADVSDVAFVLGASGHGVGDIPPGVVPRRSDGVGRTAQFGTVVVSSGRERGYGARAAARRIHRAAKRPVRISWFSVAALMGIVILAKVGVWYKRNKSTAGKSQA